MDPPMRNWHMPRHQAPGPTAAKYAGRGMKNNPSFLHPPPRDRAGGMGKGNAYPDGYRNKRRSVLPDYRSRDNLQSKSRLEREGMREEYVTAPFSPQEESDEGSEATTMASNDSDVPLPAQQDQLQVNVQDDFVTRPIHDPRERNVMRSPLKRPNMSGRQCSRAHTMI